MRIMVHCTDVANMHYLEYQKMLHAHPYLTHLMFNQNCKIVVRQSLSK